MSSAPSATTLSDEELAATMTPAALEELQRRYQARLWGFFKARGVHHVDAEDLIQKVFLKLLEKGGFEPSRTGRAGDQVRFCSWVFTIAYRLLINHWRGVNKIVLFSSFVQPSTTADESFEAFEAQLPAEGWETELQVLINLARLREALEDCKSKLNEQERTVIDLWLVNDGQMRLREMAEAIEVKSPTTPQRYLQRAFQQLQDCLDKKGYNPAGSAEDNVPAPPPLA
jgi:RNA polymerase sigma factor (sigma-70 family)